MTKTGSDRTQRGTDSAVKVGELAAATGLTVRTLHYYDEIGLLSPSRRTGAGHRLYSARDVERLYRIGLLRQLGLRLDEVAAALGDPDWDLLATVNRHIARLDQRLGVEHRLRNRLAAMAEALARHRGLDIRELLDTLEDMAMLDTKIQRRIPTLVYRDIAAAHEFLTTVFGFEPGRIARTPDGTVYHAEVTAGDGVIWLHQVSEQFGLHSPQTLGACTDGMSIVVDDVDAHHRHAEQRGADIVYSPTDQPYGYREYSARDLEQRLWSFMSPLT
ncbi:MerR family transcriptional regulator [Nocardia brevicatena]|uniref:MerR family transcriptional regulator n=1 Tax=Nocardia brevicatena TaxID=37327 RepID=UPI001FE18C06|nr:MerR family transcriptional regulator [Nocardia brevicatena]